MPSAKDSLKPSKSEVDSLDDSSGDSDFAGSLSSPSSGSEVEGKRLKRKARSEEVDSGDEKVIEEGGRKRKKRSKKDIGEVEEGVGTRLRKRKDGIKGLTRSSETVNSDDDKKLISDVEGATVDVDKIWAQMISNPQPASSHARSDTAIGSSKPSENVGDPHNLGVQVHDTNKRTEIGHPIHIASTSEEMINIKRTYAFAGETITEEKTVPKSSAEAHLYLRSQQTDPDHVFKPGIQPSLRRPKKRASMFEPSSGSLGQASNTNKGKGPKLNTIEKSKLDWAGYVDKEGMKDELDGAEKSKDGYLGKKDFLDRVVAKRDHDMLNAKKR